MVYCNTYTGFILRYIGALETNSHCLIGFIMSVLSKDILFAMIVKVGFTDCLKSESRCLLKFVKI